MGFAPHADMMAAMVSCVSAVGRYFCHGLPCSRNATADGAGASMGATTERRAAARRASFSACRRSTSAARLASSGESQAAASGMAQTARESTEAVMCRGSMEDILARRQANAYRANPGRMWSTSRALNTKSQPRSLRTQ